jgi:hypothetical protein
MSALQKLLSCASPPLARTAPDAATFSAFGRVGAELLDLLRRRNGFFAFESALLVRPSGSSPDLHTLETWNEPALWRDAYAGTPLPSDALYFAEDAFGAPFALDGRGVLTVDPETGASERIASDLEGWARAVLDDPAFLTASPLAHDWQVKHGALAPGQRLVPARPFVLGGEYAVDNLVAYDAARGMRVRAGLARQLVDVPDGSSVVFRLERGSR